MLIDNNQTTAGKIASFLGKELKGNDIEILWSASMSSVSKNCITFSKAFDEDFLRIANEISELLVLACSEYAGRLNCTYIISQNPRLDFLRVVKEFFTPPEEKPTIHPSTIIEAGAKIGKDVAIGAHCYIGADVIIGDRAKIHHNVVILGRTEIGNDCLIKSGAVIGEEGFGFENDESGKPQHFPHVGSIKIGNGVFIGCNSTVERATIDVTVIGNNVKIDDHVQIGHNCVIGDNTIITAGTITCGGAVLGQGCWTAPNVTIKQRLTIGDGAYIGMGSVVLHDVAPGMVVAGVPAKKISKQEE